MNKESIDQLEFNKLVRLISKKAFSKPAKDDILNVKSSESIVEIDTKLDFTSEIQRFIIEYSDLDLSRVNDVEKLLFDFRYENYSYEEFKEIIGVVIVANLFFQKTIELDSENYPQVYDLRGKITNLPEIESRFAQIFSPEGQILDSASSKLFSLRKRRRNLRTEIVSTLQNRMNDHRYENMFQDKIVTQRDDRFVVPMKETAARNSDGIVHGISSSKATVFIEPQEIVVKNNEMAHISEEEKEEIQRIFVSYTKDIQNCKELIQENYTQLVKLDYYQAVASYSNSILASAPNIVEDCIVELKNARHPLLIEQLGDRKKVIPFDLELGIDYKMLVISGPNTGGKTVTLKSIGLLTMMALHGFPIPASSESKIGFFRKVFADIGDKQSIENSLSTYSSHIKCLDEIVKFGDDKSLILIDEIGSATDPEQGSALAQAMMERITDRKMIGVITTHYTILKIFAEDHPECVNAAMHFDPELHSPTYRFKVGLPGNSFAIEVAERLGIPNDLIARAKELTGNQNIELTELLVKMNEQKKSLARNNYQFELKTRLLEQKLKEYENRIAKFEDEKKEIKKKSLKQAQNFLSTMQEELHNEIESIKKIDRKERKKSAEKVLEKVVSKNTSMKKEILELQPQEFELIENPQVGMMAYVVDFDAVGKIEEIFKKDVKIDLDGIFFTVKRNKIFKTNKTKEVVSLASKNVSREEKKVKMELKLLGMTYDEATPLIDEFIDDAQLNGFSKLRIVHGKGTGILRGKVRQYFRRDKRILKFYAPAPEAGGDGVTIIELN